MKILITTDLFATDTNGVVTSVKNLYDELKRKGHDIKILTLSENYKSRKEMDIYYIRSMPLGVYPDIRMPLSYRHKLIKEIIEWKPDIIHSQCEFFSFQFALYVSKKTGAPIVHTYHTLYEQYVNYVIPSKFLGKYGVRILSRLRLKKAKKIIAPTEKVLNTLRNYGLSNDICIIPSGICLNQHQKRLTETERKEKREALGIKEDDIVLINLGRLGTEKNLDELLILYSEAVKQNRDLRFLIVGDGPVRINLETMADKLGVSKWIVFTGMVTPQEVQDYYQLGDVFVSASTSETQGLTYIEAAANGLPLLCREDACLNNIIINGENGYKYNDSEDFFKAIDVILKNRDWRRKAGRKSEEVAAYFDKSAFGNAMEKVYLEVVE